MRSFRDLGLRAKVYVLGATVMAAAIGIAYLAFIEVTLRRVFATVEGWEAVGAFLVVTLALVAAARAMGLHESR